MVVTVAHFNYDHKQLQDGSSCYELDDGDSLALT